MKTDRKLKAENKVPTTKSAKGTRATAKVKSSNGKHLSAPYEHAPIGIVEASLEGKYINANEEFCRITGYDKNELLHYGIKDLTHEDDYDLDLRLHESLVAGKIPFYKLEKRFMRKDGSDIWVELTRTLARDGDGVPLYTVGVVLDISDRKHVERVLRDSVERLRLATESARMFMWEWDFNREIYTLADNFEHVLGFSGGLMPQNDIETVFRLSPAEDTQAVLDAVEKAIQQGGDLHSLQYRMINPDTGQVVWLEVNGKIVFDAEGKATRMFGVAQNITENKKAEESLQLARRQAEQSADRTARLQQVTAALSEALTPPQIAEVLATQGAPGFGAVTSSLMILTEDGQFLELLYSTTEASLVRPYGRFPVSLPVPAADAVRSGEPVWLESRQQYLERYPHMADQINAWGLQAAIAVPMSYKDHILGVFALSFDRILPYTLEDRDYILTLARQGAQALERARAEDALRESEERFRALVSQATAGIAESGMNGEFVFVNPRFSEMLGYSEPELLGKTIWELTYEGDVQENKRLFERMLAQGESYQFEKRFLRRDGSPLWTNVTVSTIRDLEGKPKGGVGVVIDIEERKQAEQALAEFAREQAALYKFVDQLHHTASFDDIFDAALDAIRSALQCDRASILLFDQADVMRFVAWQGLSDEYRKATDGHSPWTPDVLDPEPIAMDNVDTAELSDSLRAIIKSEGIGSLAFIPLVSNGRLIGKFMVYFDQPHRFTEDEVDLGLTIARQLAFGVDRRRAEEALRDSEKRFREIFETAGVSVWVEDFSAVKTALDELRAQGVHDFRAYFAENMDFVRRAIQMVRILDVNGETLELFRARSKDDLLASLNTIFTSETENAFLEELVALAEGREMLRTETQVRTLDQHLVSVLLTVHFNLQVDDYSRVVVTLTDITERRRMEEALRLENERFMRFVNSNIVGILIGNPSGKILLANDYYLNLLGVDREDFFEQQVDWRRFTPPEWLSADEKAIQELRERGVCEPYEKEYIRTDGTRVPVYITNAMLPGPGEEIAAFVLDITQRKRAEQALRESEERFRGIVNQTIGGIAETDLTGKFVMVNDHYCEIVGYTREQLLNGTHMQDITHPDDRPKNMEFFGRLKAEGASFEIEKRYIRSDGSFVWVHNSVSAITGVDGKPRSAVAIVIDVTERKRAEEALRSSEALYRGIAGNIPGAGVYVVDKDFRYLVAEGPVTEAFGLSREMLEGRTVTEVFPDERGLRMQERLERTFAGETIGFETKHDGRTYWTRQAPLLNSMGQAIILTLDMTERKLVEEALRESEERFRAILRQATAGIVRKDAAGRLLFVNQAFCNMLGYTEGELLGKSIWDLIHEDDVEESKRSYEHMMTEGVAFKVERRLIRADGSVIWVDASVSPIMDADGKAQSVVAVEVDITARKQAEEALQQLNLQLEERVLSRTERLRTTNQALREEITERKRVEEALRRSEAVAQENETKLRTLFELLPVGISFLNNRGQVLQTNSALLDILKLSKEEFNTRTYQQRKYIRADGTTMPPSEFASARAIAENRTVYNVEMGIVLESGGVVWTSVSAAPVDVADVGVVVVTVDITDNKRAEQALQESHARLRILSQRLVEVQEEERRALARELHDRVGQTLAALNINLIIINGQLSGDAAEQIGTRLNDSMKLVAETIALVRDVMTDLRPAVLDDYGLEAAIESHLSQFIARYDINAKFEKPGQPLPRLGASIEMTFLRIAQEALMNIARHAQATQVNLSLRHDADEICLIIQDNGIGIQSWQEANRPGSHGLTIMRERAEAFDGTMRVRSLPGQGTKIEVSIPLKGKKESGQEKNS